MKISQGFRVIELVPQGHTTSNKLVLAGAEMHELDGRYIGFWHSRDIPREYKRELLRELAANWLPPQYDRDALR